MSRIKGKYASTNGGVSDKYDTFFVTGWDWLNQDTLEENTDNLPVLVIKRKKAFSLSAYNKHHYYAEPLQSPYPGNLGWMNGGNLLDMAIEEQEQVYIHDRQESQEQYNALSS